MWPDQVSNLGPLAHESDALPTVLRGPVPKRAVWSRSTLFPISSPLYCIVKHICSNFKTIKANGYTFRGSNSVFYCCLPYKFGSSHKGKNLLHMEQILSFKSRPLLRGLRPPGKQTGRHENCFPLKTRQKKMKVYVSNYSECPFFKNFFSVYS